MEKLNKLNTQNIILLILFIIIVAAILVVITTNVDTEEKKEGNVKKTNADNSEDGQLPVKEMTYTEAIDSKNSTNCQYINDSQLEEICNIKLSICDNDECYLEKARLNMNESMCFKIEDENLRVLCSSSISLSTIFERSIMEDDITICDELIYNETIQWCYDNYYYAKKVNENNNEFCNEIVNIEIKNECFK